MGWTGLDRLANTESGEAEVSEGVGEFGSAGIPCVLT